MAKVFNVTGACIPKQHYMVNIEQRLCEIKQLVDDGKYFTINKARQYGKTTTLIELQSFLQADYYTVLMDFQVFGADEFANENVFALSFARTFLRTLKRNQLFMTEALQAAFDTLEDIIREERKSFRLQRLFEELTYICEIADRRIVLMIDEVDSASNNQVFLDFLAQLRAYYLGRMVQPTFQSVILAGVYDVKNFRRKLRPDGDHKLNSPWNIAADFDVEMNFSCQCICGMLHDYEKDYQTGMDVNQMAKLLYDYTSGYPFLVSKLCKLIDEEIAGSDDFVDRSAAWTVQGFLAAVKILLAEKNTLFESLLEKLKVYPELKQVLHTLLFNGKNITYNPDDDVMDMASMFGFVKNINGNVVIANRIFETRLYNWFLTTNESQRTELYNVGIKEKNHFIQNGHLNMEHILERFVVHFDDLYGDQPERFVEEDGRRYFLLYLRPIINGAGNYYVESQTRNMERTDVIIDYYGEQYVVELKIWHGNAYNQRGEKQLSDYLDYYHLDKGYMLSFNFNQKKQIGVKHINIGNKLLIEAVV